MKRGDPCKTRMKVHWDGYWWRVFELAQPGQRSSRHPDARFTKWKSAMQVAHGTAQRDRALCLKEQRKNTTREGTSWATV